jgi:hypothetical protein
VSQVTCTRETAYMESGHERNKLLSSNLQIGTQDQNLADAYASATLHKVTSMHKTTTHMHTQDVYRTKYSTSHVYFLVLFSTPIRHPRCRFRSVNIPQTKITNLLRILVFPSCSFVPFVVGILFFGSSFSGSSVLLFC